MTTEAQKTHEFPVIWYNSPDELEAAFGKDFLKLRSQMIDLGKAQQAKFEEMIAVADKVVSAQGKVPAGFAVTLKRSFKTGGIGLTFEAPKAKKAAKANKAKPGDFSALFGPDKTRKA